MASYVVRLLSCGGGTATAEHLLSCVLGLLLLLLLLLFCSWYVEMWRREGPALVRWPADVLDQLRRDVEA